jgi:polyhydroxyalkanoate synthase
MTVLERIARSPLNALELANIVLTTDDAVVGATPREVVWTHRGTTLYRCRSTERRYPVPLLLVSALINRPEIFDLRPGGSLVEYLLDEAFNLFLVDWGVPDEEDAEMGLDNYVCDELDWAVRETLRASGADELTLLGWCIGATLCAMYCGLDRGEQRTAVRNLALLTMPVDGRGSNYAAGWAIRSSTSSRSPRPGGCCPARPSISPTNCSSP